MKQKLVLVILICFLLFSCAGLENALLQAPKLSVKDVRINKVTLGEQNIGFRLNIYNPNSIPIPIKGLSYKLDLNNVEFASGFSENSISIPAAGSGEMDLSIGGNLISFIQKFGGIAKSSIDYQISGDIALVSSSLRFPYSHVGELSLRSLF